MPIDCLLGNELPQVSRGLEGLSARDALTVQLSGVPCSRLSDNPAPGAPESGPVFRSCYGVDGALQCHSNGDAGNRLGNPDIRVPDSKEKEDGLGAMNAEEETNAVGNENTEDEETKDLGGTKNREDTLGKNGHPRTGSRAEGRNLRHVPGGTWLTKVQSFLKDKFF
ncbi:hypothetical protein NDU88_009713 [Pleurodeles waltl]|uniref:Uncharacterized protein n=1 Tax=Pleurodeles waltl TaxID=8319 RepID=A0AAV7QWJ4_PLEWA|nr:hypothetical protein NDU88_009713 [Pleurodeles waltl]